MIRATLLTMSRPSPRTKGKYANLGKTEHPIFMPKKKKKMTEPGCIHRQGEHSRKRVRTDIANYTNIEQDS